MSPQPLEIAADVVGLDDADPARVCRIRGQVAVATTIGRVVAVRLVPAGAAGLRGGGGRGRRRPTWSCSGPGSWFTSVLPHLLVPDLLAALVGSRARRVVVLNLAAQPGETAGFSPQQHLEVLCGARAGPPGGRGAGGHRRGGGRSWSRWQACPRWARGCCWRRWPPATARRGTTRRLLAAAYRQVLGADPAACGTAPAGTGNGAERKSGGPQWR